MHVMKYIITTLLVFTGISLAGNRAYSQDNAAEAVAEAPVRDLEEGAALFKARCTACHKLDKKLIGPPLKGITERQDEAWLIKFIRNSGEMIAAGDPDAVAIFNEYNQTQMITNLDLSDDQILNILAYIDPPVVEQPVAAATTLPANATAANTDQFGAVDFSSIERPVEDKPNLRPVSWSDFTFWFATAIFIFGVIIMIYLGVSLDGVMRSRQ
jgi:cytochrome c2